MMRMLSILCLSLLAGCANSGKATDKANEWVEANKPGWSLSVPPDCLSADNDSNGMVSCTVVVLKDDQEDTIKLECPSNWLPQPINNRCKLGGSGG